MLAVHFVNVHVADQVEMLFDQRRVRLLLVHRIVRIEHRPDRSAASGVVTCSPLGATISQCRPTNAKPSESRMARYSRRSPAEISDGFSANVKGAISSPRYPAERTSLAAAGNVTP